MHLTNSSEVRAKDNYRKSSVIKTLAPWAHVRDSYRGEIQNHSSNYVIHKRNNIHKQQRARKDFPPSHQRQMLDSLNPAHQVLQSMSKIW